MNPIHGTKIIPLRWFANCCESIAHSHLNKALYYDDHDDHGFAYKYHSFLSHWFYKPYFKWGTRYGFDIKEMLNEWNNAADVQELMQKLGSDYDENGIPYWHYHEINCSCTKCMP